MARVFDSSLMNEQDRSLPWVVECEGKEVIDLDQLLEDGRPVHTMTLIMVAAMMDKWGKEDLKKNARFIETPYGDHNYFIIKTEHTKETANA